MLDYFSKKWLGRCFLAALISALPIPARAQQGALIIRNVNIVDVVNNRLEPGRDVVILGKDIANVAAHGHVPAPQDGQFIEGAGKYLMPGLWDFHVHVFTAPGEEDLALPLYILNGVTGIRDAGGFRSLKDMRAVAVAVERGERVGPRIELAGALVDGPPGAWPGQTRSSEPMRSNYSQMEIGASVR